MATLAEIELQDVRAFIASLFERKVTRRVDGKKRQVPVAVSTVRGHVAALKALLATAVEDGLIRHNPASGVRIAGTGVALLESNGGRLIRTSSSGS